MASPGLPFTPLGISTTSTTTGSIDVSASSVAKTPGSQLSRTASGGGKEGNVQVVCRFRPAREKDPFAWFEASEEQVRVVAPSGWDG